MISNEENRPHIRTAFPFTALTGGMTLQDIEKIRDFIREIVKEEIAKQVLLNEENKFESANSFQPLKLDKLFPDKRDYNVWCKEKFDDILK